MNTKQTLKEFCESHQLSNDMHFAQLYNDMIDIYFQIEKMLNTTFYVVDTITTKNILCPVLKCNYVITDGFETEIHIVSDMNMCEISFKGFEFIINGACRQYLMLPYNINMMPWYVKYGKMTFNPKMFTGVTVIESVYEVFKILSEHSSYYAPQYDNGRINHCVDFNNSYAMAYNSNVSSHYEKYKVR